VKFFITGATGFIGGSVTKKLINAGHEVNALVRFPHKAQHLSLMGVKLFQGDITDKESMHHPVKNVDGIFHIAGWYKIGTKDKDLGYKINVQGTRNVLELMKEYGIKKGVYTSTLAVFSDTKGEIVDENYRFTGKHLSEYDRTKWLAHYKIAEPMMNSGLPLVIVQPGLVYGPGDTSDAGKAMEMYINGKLPMLPKKTAFCWAHVDDIADGHILAMEKGVPGQSYIIGGLPYTMEKAYELAEKITGIRTPKMRPAPKTMKFLSTLMKLIGAVLPLLPTYSAEALRVVAGVTYLGDNSKAKDDLGYNVRPLEEGLRGTLEYMIEQNTRKKSKHE